MRICPLVSEAKAKRHAVEHGDCAVSLVANEADAQSGRPGGLGPSG